MNSEYLFTIEISSLDFHPLVNSCSDVPKIDRKDFDGHAAHHNLDLIKETESSSLGSEFFSAFDNGLNAHSSVDPCLQANKIERKDFDGHHEAHKSDKQQHLETSIQDLAETTLTNKDQLLEAHSAVQINEPVVQIERKTFDETQHTHHLDISPDLEQKSLIQLTDSLFTSYSQSHTPHSQPIQILPSVKISSKNFDNHLIPNNNEKLSLNQTSELTLSFPFTHPAASASTHSQVQKPNTVPKLFRKNFDGQLAPHKQDLQDSKFNGLGDIAFLTANDELIPQENPQLSNLIYASKPNQSHNQP